MSTCTQFPIPENPSNLTRPHPGYSYCFFPAKGGSAYSSYTTRARRERAVYETRHSSSSDFDTVHSPCPQFFVLVRRANDSLFTGRTISRKRTLCPHHIYKTKIRPITYTRTVHVLALQAARCLYVIKAESGRKRPGLALRTKN